MTTPGSCVARIAVVIAIVFFLCEIPRLSRASETVGSLPLAIETMTVSFSPFDETRTRFGRLEWRGGVEIVSQDERFGGLSGLVMTDGGAGMLAISDLGWWFKAQIGYTDNRLSEVTLAQMARLLDAEGQPFRGKSYQDAESIAAIGDGSGDVLVAFERQPRILRYPFGRSGMAALPEALPIPPEIATGPDNQELEAIGRFPDRGPMQGALILVSERQLTRQGGILGWIVGGPSPGRFSLERIDDFDVTDVAIDPVTQSVFTLERRFSIFTGAGMMIRRFHVSDLAGDRPAGGEILIRANQTQTIDNMEGLGLHRTAGGELRLTVLSDDNYNGFQRTLLMQFALDEPGP